MSVKGILFLDANQYLDLYRMPTGKKLLAALDEQRDNIFVTAQVVDQVYRKKVKVAGDFLSDQFKKFELNNVAIPVHLFKTTRDVSKLYVELAALYPSSPIVHCFDNVDEGIRDFAATANVKADKLPTAQEAEQIRQEQESLPPLDCAGRL